MSGQTGQMQTYLNRITSEHRNQPNFVQSVAVSLAPIIGVQGTQNNLSQDFDIDLAVGPQLDQVGLWLGVPRQLSTPLTDIFFSWDTPSLGWDQGVWLGNFQSTTGYTEMDDSTYRAVLQLRAAMTHWDGTRVQLGEFVTETFGVLFPNLTMNLTDNYNMTITFQLFGQLEYNKYTVNGLSALIQELFIQGFFTAKPMGVAVIYQIWNGSAFVTEPFTFSVTATAPSSGDYGTGTLAVSGTVNPAGDASVMRFALTQNSAAPPAWINNASPSAPNAYFDNPTTYDNSAGTFSATLELANYGATAGTWFLWVWDHNNGAYTVSDSITITN